MLTITLHKGRGVTLECGEAKIRVVYVAHEERGPFKIASLGLFPGNGVAIAATLDLRHALVMLLGEHPVTLTARRIQPSGVALCIDAPEAVQVTRDDAQARPSQSAGVAPWRRT